MPQTAERDARMAVAGRLFWSAVVLAHIVAAALWLYEMPHGFPLGHRRGIANTIIPPWFIMAMLCILAALWRGRPRRARATVVAVPAFWWAVAVTVICLFPSSGPLPAVVAALCGVFASVAALLTWSRARPSLAVALIFAAIFALGGAVGVWAQRAEPPGTRPLLAALPDVKPVTDVKTLPQTIVVTKAVHAQPQTACVTATCRRVSIDVLPMLTFHSTSPDGFWTCFSLDRSSDDAPRRLVAADWYDYPAAFSYQGRQPGVMRLGRTAEGAVVDVEAYTLLDRPVYSHLNSFCEIHVRGHRRLSLGFSPCRDSRIEVRPFGYPRGEPVRMACLNDDLTFEVLEATSAEKGPFTVLAKGTMERDEPLGIYIYDEDQVSCEIVLDDWAAQADTSLSPTAGWGFPANAIEFRLEGQSPDSMAAIFVTLAGTSVGRGFDSVGHAPGVYRSRIHIRPESPEYSLLDDPRGAAGRPAD